MSKEFNPNSNDAMFARLETLMERVEKRLDEGDAKFDQQDDRLRRLEGWKYYVLGGAAVAGFIAASIVAAAWDWLKSKF